MVIDTDNALRPPVPLDGLAAAGRTSWAPTSWAGTCSACSWSEPAPRSSSCVVGVLFAGVLGVTLGLMAGYFGKAVDNVIMRVVDIEMSIPGILFMLLLAAVAGTRHRAPSSSRWAC